MRKGYIFCLLVTAGVLFSTPAQAAFEHSIFGVRPMGMGGAFTAVADDSNALLWNPAGLALLNRKEFTIMDSRDFDLTYGPSMKSSFIGMVVPLSGMGTMGFSYTTMGNKRVLMEKAAALSYAVKPWKRTALGLTIKRLSLEPGGIWVDPGDTLAKSYDSLGADFGLLVNPGGRFSFGAMIRNIGANIGVNNDNVSTDLAFGIACRVFNNLTLSFDMLEKLNIDNTRGSQWEFAGGVEYLVGNYLALRGGYTNDTLCAGLGFRMEDRAQIDYAFFKHEIGDTHRASISVRFGKEKEKKQEEPEEVPQISKFPAKTEREQAFEKLEQEQVEPGKTEDIEDMRSSLSEAAKRTIQKYRRGVEVSSVIIHDEEKMEAAEELLRMEVKSEIPDEAVTEGEFERSKFAQEVLDNLRERHPELGRFDTIKKLRVTSEKELSDKMEEEPVIKLKEETTTPQPEKVVKPKSTVESKAAAKQVRSIPTQTQISEPRSVADKGSTKETRSDDSRPPIKKVFVVDARQLSKKHIFKGRNGVVYISINVIQDSFAMRQSADKRGIITLKGEKTVKIRLRSRDVVIDGRKVRMRYPVVSNRAMVFVPAEDIIRLLDAAIKLPAWLE